MTYELETMAMTARQDTKLEAEEIKMIRFELGSTRRDRMRNILIQRGGDK